MPNQENCQIVVDYLLAHRENHFQGSWFTLHNKPEANLCGTTLCIAGAAVLLCGELDLVKGNDGQMDAYIEGIPMEAFFKEEGTDEESYFAKTGADLLGFDDEQAAIFGIMDEDRALKLLKEYANGEC